MVDVLTQAIYDRLAGDATLDAMLARTVAEPGTAPAIYTSWPPPTAALPYCYAPGESLDDEPDDPATDARFRNITREVHFYAPRPNQGGGSTATVQEMAERGRELFHQQPLVLPYTGGLARNLICLVSGPVNNDGEHAFGRVLMVRLRVQSSVVS